MYITHWQIYALEVHVHKYSSVSLNLEENLVLVDAGASLNALSITATLGLFTAPVVRRVDSAINWINCYPLGIAQLVLVILILWIAIYPVDSAIQLLNNRELVNSLLYR